MSPTPPGFHNSATGVPSFPKAVRQSRAGVETAYGAPGITAQVPSVAVTSVSDHLVTTRLNGSMDAVLAAWADPSRVRPSLHELFSAAFPNLSTYTDPNMR